MTRIREEITIRAPASAVWEAVHTDLENVPRWAGYLRRAESVQGRPGPNWKVRYDLELPGGFAASLTLLHTVWEPFRRCAGRFIGLSSPKCAIFDGVIPASDGLSGVHTGPGATALTRMPFSNTFDASDLVKAWIAPLVAE